MRAHVRLCAYRGERVREGCRLYRLVGAAASFTRNLISTPLPPPVVISGFIIQKWRRMEIERRVPWLRVNQPTKQPALFIIHYSVFVTFSDYLTSSSISLSIFLFSFFCFLSARGPPSWKEL